MYWLISVIVLVIEVELQVLLQLVAGQFLAVQVSLVHVNGVNLRVAISGVVVDPLFLVHAG